MASDQTPWSFVPVWSSAFRSRCLLLFPLSLLPPVAPNVFVWQSSGRKLSSHWEDTHSRAVKNASLLVFAFPHPNYTRGQFVPFLPDRRHKVREELSWARSPVSGAILALLPKEVWRKKSVWMHWDLKTANDFCPQFAIYYSYLFFELYDKLYEIIFWIESIPNIPQCIFSCTGSAIGMPVKNAGWREQLAALLVRRCQIFALVSGFPMWKQHVGSAMKCQY